MKYLSLMVLLSGIFVQGVSAQQVNIQGVVYEDANGNGRRERKEALLSDVAISNGVDVVTTDAKGRYSIPVKDGQIVFVVKPAGYSLPTDSNLLSQGYYIYKPEGSPHGLKYAGSAPTGKVPNSLDFGLKKQEEQRDFQVLVFGDPQVYTEEELGYFTKGIIQDIGDTSPFAFGLSLGDLVGDDLTLHPLYKREIKKLGLPWYNVMGNHDLNYDVKDDRYSDETFEQNFGPNNYSFNYGNTHFIVLDNIIYPHPVTGKGYLGGFREDQLQFVENDLKLVPKDKLIVVAYHIPLFLNDRSSSHFRPEDQQRFMDLLSAFPHTLSLSAHTHFQTQVFLTAEDGWKRATPHHEYNVGTTSGDWYSGVFNEQGVPVSTMRDGTPKGYMFLRISDNSYAFDYKVAGKPLAYQMAVMGASSVEEKYVRRYPFYVNFFVGKEGDQVQYKFDDANWQEMSYVSDVDPGFAYSIMHYDHADSNDFVEGRRPSDAVESTHLWKANYPKLSKGTHVLHVRAIDMFGKTHTSSKSIEVR